MIRARNRHQQRDQPEAATAHGRVGGRAFVKLPAILVALAAASVALLPGILLDRDRRVREPRAPSWAMPPLAAIAVGGGGWAWETNAGVAPVTFIYVDRECLHCKAEMERWETLAPEFDFDSHLWVVASPGSEMDEARWVPPLLRGQTIHDTDGSIRAQLGVRAVPTTFWVDATDTVRIVQVGQSSRQVLMDNILTIKHLEQVNE